MPGLNVATAAVSLVRETEGKWDPVRGQLPEPYEGDLRATALALRVDDEPLCFVSCDALVIPHDVLAKATQQIASRTGIPLAGLVICATHTHHGCGTLDILGHQRNRAFCERMEDGIVRAALSAWQALTTPGTVPAGTDVELLFGVGQEATVGRNSRLLLKDGMVGWSGYEEADIVQPTGTCDPALFVFAFRRPDGQLASMLFNHSVHNIGTRHPERRRVRSPGFYGLTAQDLERQHHAVTLFLAGAFGSTHNITFNGSGVPGAECVARMTDAVERALATAQQASCRPFRAIRRSFTYRLRSFDEAKESAAVTSYLAKYKPSAEREIEVFRQMREEMASVQGEERQTWLHAIRLGDVAMVGIPGEMFAQLGLEIRRRSPFRHTCVIGLANGCLGYIPDRASHELGGYQAWVGWHSPFAPGTGEDMVDQSIAMLAELSKQS